MREWNASTQAFVLCPKLEMLTIDHTNLCDTTGTVFADMVEDRWRRSLAAGKTFKLQMATRRDIWLDTSQERRRIYELMRLGLDVMVSMSGWTFD